MYQKYLLYQINHSFIYEKKEPELNFLKKKRMPENFLSKTDNNFTLEKEINFSILTKNFQKQSESRNSENNPYLYTINSEINNCIKSFNEDNSNLDKKIIGDDIINNEPSQKLLSFDIKKNINEKSLLECGKNNEIKVLKNGKVVYINTYLCNLYSTSKAIKKMNKINFVIRNERSSKYRGVSRNGNSWQVLTMINKKKQYLGSYQSEELAARIYDIQAIKNRGFKARTNFTYNNIQIKKILEKNINIKCNNISDINNQLIN